MVQAIKELLKDYGRKIKNYQDLEAAKRAICKKHRIPAILNSDILKEYRLLNKTGAYPENLTLARVLRKRSVRTLSGIAPVAVLTKPYPCPGSCAYCPHEKDVPASYLSNEPAVMRAIRCLYDPYQQVTTRLRSLENNGHEPNKIEIIVIGGTWSYLPKKYRYWFILNCFKAANDYGKTNKRGKGKYLLSSKLKDLENYLALEQKKNEKADYKIIGLTLETRPDYINIAELLQMRDFGCTRVEIGVQVVDDKILKINRRGHGVKEIISATKLLKSYGFKVTYHLMPALPGATPSRDLALFKKLFQDENYQPDQIKFYPTVVTRGSLLYKWYKAGKYKPYSDRVLQRLIAQCKAVVPPYVRIIRLIRDIPEESIIAGNKITNLRQIMQQRGVVCRCIRCREVKDGSLSSGWRLNVVSYQASGGTEYFISADNPSGQVLYGFCRLRLDYSSPVAPAIIRELHVYGELVPVGGSGKIQHSGLGQKLLLAAEDIARREGAKKLAVISGVGVRGYYRRQGFSLAGNYMIKPLK